MSKSDVVLSQFPPRRRVAIFFDDPSLTHQEFKADTEIVNIMKRFTNFDPLAVTLLPNALLGDFTNIPDYREALDFIIAADDSFNQLPSPIRNRFQNDPAQFLDFVQNSDNREEAMRLGLLKPEVAKATTENLGKPEATIGAT